MWAVPALNTLPIVQDSVVDTDAANETIRGAEQGGRGVVLTGEVAGTATGGEDHVG